MIIKGFNVVPLVKKTVREIGEDRIPSLAAETAYYFFFSLFPLLLFLTPLLGLVGDGPELMESLLARLATTLPPDALSLVRRTMGEIVSASGGGGVMTLGALLAGWSGSNIFGALMNALNVAYDVSETRPFLTRLGLRLACLVVAAAVMVLATLVFLDGERLAGWVGGALGLGSFGVAVVTTLQLALAVALLVALGVMILRLLPDVQQTWWHLVVASLVMTVLWVAATLLFRLYVQQFGAFNRTYGTIGAVIVLLSWMYYTMFVVLAGAELASELHHGTGAIDPAKGATYLGRIVSESGPGIASIDTRTESVPADRA
jgi:membrane protein